MESQLAIDDLLSCAEVATMLGVSESSIRRWQRNPDFPQPSRFGRAVRWKPEQIKSWFASR